MKPKIPKTLSKEAKFTWRRLASTYVLTPSECELLRCALEAWDEMTLAREQLLREGFTVESATGTIHKHPLAEILKTSRAAFLSAWNQLNWPKTDALPVPGPGRPRK